MLGYTALEAGLRFLPVTLLSFVVAPIARQARRCGVAGALVHRRAGSRSSASGCC